MAMKFVVNRPVEVALKFATGLPVKSSWNGEDQVMFTLMNEEKMYLDPLVGTRIEAMQLKRGEPFVICKRRQGRSIEWSVTRTGESAAQAPEPGGYVATDDDVPVFDLPAPVRLSDRELVIEALRAALRVLEGGRR